MRLSERDAYFRRQRGELSMEDMDKERRRASAAAKKAEEKRQKAAKEAAKGQPLPGMEVRR